MKKPGRPTSIDAEAVLACQAKGMTQQQTADHLGISLSGVRANWKRAEGHGRPSPQAEEIASRLAAGEKPEAIAAALGISASTVRRHRRTVEGARPYKKAQ